ncbi:MAG: VWA domain-containing protein [Planctomycetia bacterium]|nr:VWA domain-containing protein [Planctomycetia bacterium]
MREFFGNHFSNALSDLPGLWGYAAWAAALAVPPFIILLYFLKLKRMPVQVPSTYLWLRSIEDLRVNSIWQRLRKNLLLFLQLLLIFLAILALLRPNWAGTTLQGDRFILMIDVSASMAATDVQPNRLEAAKREALKVIDAMDSGDHAMVIAFSDTVQVVEEYTSNRNKLRRAVEDLKPTQRSTNFSQALTVASGLANPGRTGFKKEDVKTAEAVPATMYIFSDGNFPPTAQTVGNLTPEYIPIGEAESENLAITEFGARRNEEHAEKLQAFALLENFGPEDVNVRAELYLGPTMIDVKDVEIGAKSSTGVPFDLADVESGVLSLKINATDSLAVDDAAYVAINLPRPAEVLLVTADNKALDTALSNLGDRINLDTRPPSFLAEEVYRIKAAGGLYDLVIFDRCLPKAEKDDANTPTPMPQANTWFVGAMPKLEAWGWKPGMAWPPEKASVPQIIDIDKEHPVMQFMDLGNVRVAESLVTKPPSGGTALIDTSEGAVFSIAPREGFEDAVLGFHFDAAEAVTDWQVRLSFPVFVNNLVQYLGSGQEAVASSVVRPGQQVELRLDTVAEEVTVIDPAGQSRSVRRTKQNTYNYTAAEQVGVYQVRDKGKVLSHFTVNLFDSAESDLPPKDNLQLTKGTNVKATQALEPSRQETWKYLLLLALTVLVFEWYIYNRRVYL